jgi:ABC-2 type transport system permease protein
LGRYCSGSTPREARGDRTYEDIEKYFAFFQIGLKNVLVYKWDIFTSAFFRMVSPLVMLAVWFAIYSGSQATTIGGFTFPKTYSYFFAAALMVILIDASAEQVMQSDVMSGAVAVYLTKPLKYILRVVSSDLSEVLFMSVLAGIPLSVIVVYLLHITVSLQLLLMLAAELLTGLFLLYAIGVFLGMVSFYVTNAGGIFNIAWTSVFFMGGSYMPLNFFPNGISSLLQLLPFQILVYTPAVTLIGSMPLDQAMQNTLVALAWCFAICAFDYVVWKRSLRNLAVGGG